MIGLKKRRFFQEKQLQNTNFLMVNSMHKNSYKNSAKLNWDMIPEPVFDENPDLVNFYRQAWEYAWDHVVSSEKTLISPYIDEGCNLDTIWIWDTCFMTLFCRYAPDVFPGLESLDNFYQVMHDKQKMTANIHHPDNPPLFAWVELEHFKLTGDFQRLKKILSDKKYLQKHFYFFKNLQKGKVFSYANVPCSASWQKIGYTWNGVCSGMDNTSRGNGQYDSILWIDAIAQQALSASCIAQAASLLNDNKTVEKFNSIFEELKEIINHYYWDEQDGFYYDIAKTASHEHVKVKTPASYWVMLAGICSQEQAERMHEHAQSPNWFGGERPWPSVAPSETSFAPDGKYWLGGIWLPTAYAATKALDKYGFHDTAMKNSYALLLHMYKVWRNFTPATIWECYSPTETKPAINKDNVLVRKDFCGWSALGPISMFIENVIGFWDFSATKSTVSWNLTQKCRHGIKGLRFGRSIIADIIYKSGEIKINTNKKFTLKVNGKKLQIPAGKSIYNIEI